MDISYCRNKIVNYEKVIQTASTYNPVTFHTVMRCQNNGRQRAQDGFPLFHSP